MSGGHKKSDDKEEKDVFIKSNDGNDYITDYLNQRQKEDPNFAMDMLKGKHMPGFNGFPIENSYAGRKIRDRRSKISGIFLIAAVLIVIIVTLIKYFIK